MYAAPDQVQLYLKDKLPAVLPVVIGVSANALFWGGSFIPFNPAEAEFFVYLNAAIILLGIMLAVAGVLMALVCGLRNVSCTAFSGIVANSIVLMAAGLLVWGVVFHTV